LTKPWAKKLSFQHSSDHSLAPERQLSVVPDREMGGHDRDVDDAGDKVEEQPSMSAVDGVYVNVREPLMVFSQRGSKIACSK
jgi:hypothetical protein